MQWNYYNYKIIIFPWNYNTLKYTDLDSKEPNKYRYATKPTNVETIDHYVKN